MGLPTGEFFYLCGLGVIHSLCRVRQLWFDDPEIVNQTAERYDDLKPNHGNDQNAGLGGLETKVSS
jgi:hypothetical protein